MDDIQLDDDNPLDGAPSQLVETPQETTGTKIGEVSDFEKELIKTITALHEMYKGMKDKITKIKLKETINVLKKQKIGKKITDEQVSALMMSYELIKEINNVNGKKS